MNLSPSMNFFIFVVILICVFFTIQIIYLVIKGHRRKPEVPNKLIIGAKGKALTDISKESGRVFVNGAIWDATCNNGPIKKDQKISVVSIDGMELLVEKREN
ncbi:NfeD family protein [bacterium]|nr:NfeD family protein [bacterium]